MQKYIRIPIEEDFEKGQCGKCPFYINDYFRNSQTGKWEMTLTCLLDYTSADCGIEVSTGISAEDIKQVKIATEFLKNIK